MAEADLGFTERGGYSLVHRTVFVYDALMAEECIGALLRGGEISYRRVQRRTGRVVGYQRLPMQEDPLLAGAVQTGDAEHSFEGIILERLQPNEVKAIDAFVCKEFDRLTVDVVAEDGFGGTTQLEALMYVCPEESAAKLLDAAGSWSFPDFRRKHLGACIEHHIKPARQRYLAEEAEEAAAQKAEAAAQKAMASMAVSGATAAGLKD